MAGRCPTSDLTLSPPPTLTPSPAMLAFSVTQHVLLRPTAGPLLFSALSEDPSHDCFSSSFQDQLKYHPLKRTFLTSRMKNSPQHIYPCPSSYSRPKLVFITVIVTSLCEIINSPFTCSPPKCEHLAAGLIGCSVHGPPAQSLAQSRGSIRICYKIILEGKEVEWVENKTRLTMS